MKRFFNAVIDALLLLCIVASVSLVVYLLWNLTSQVTEPTPKVNTTDNTTTTEWVCVESSEEPTITVARPDSQTITLTLRCP